MNNRPEIVCLCGSTRFYEDFREANYQQTLAGRIVLSVGFYPHAADKAHAGHVGVTAEEKRQLDVLHLRKIDLADAVLILNRDGYIGESTTRELAYAVVMHKRVEWLEDDSSETCFAKAAAFVEHNHAEVASWVDCVTARKP